MIFHSTACASLKPKARRFLIAISIALFLLAVFMVWRQRVKSEVLINSQASSPPKSPLLTSVIPPTLQEPPIKKSPSHNGQSPGRANNLIVHIDRATLLRHLPEWIKNRDGVDSKVIACQEILDVDGNLSILNVLVTTGLNNPVSEESIQAQLASLEEREKVLRVQMADASHVGNVGLLNQLATEMEDMRTSLVAQNAIFTYKLGASTDQPPVLAFWPGLPFEFVRQGAAQRFATAKLGSEAKLDTLVRYTSATALLRFIDDSNKSILVDPIRMTEVRIDLGNATSRKAGQNIDEARESRVAEQWNQFLER